VQEIIMADAISQIMCGDDLTQTAHDWPP